MENDQAAQSETDMSGVTKAQVFRFLELQFSLADVDKDGALDMLELQIFQNALVHPNINVKQITLTYDTGEVSPMNAQGRYERK